MENESREGRVDLHAHTTASDGTLTPRQLVALAKETGLAAVAITLLRFGMPLCFGINKQYLDIPIGVLLVVVVVARALANSPALIAKVGGLRKKKESRAGA